RSLTLCVVEICGYGYDGLLDLLAEILFRSRLQLLQDHRRDLRRRILFAARLNATIAVGNRFHRIGNLFDLAAHFTVATPHESLDRVDGVFRVGYRLTFGYLTDQSLAVLSKGDHRRRCAGAFRVGNHRRIAPFHNRHYRVGSAQIDSDYLAHTYFSLRS